MTTTAKKPVKKVVKKTASKTTKIAKTAKIHKGAVVHNNAIIGENVEICAYAIIGENVEIGDGTVVESHANIQGPTKIGKNNHIFSFASIGTDPQDITYEKGQESNLEIGDDNIIREFVTINRGTQKQDSITRVGSKNMLMSYVHIAHDCVVGDYVIMSNNSSLAGHVKLNDYAILGGFTLVKQFIHIGCHTYTAMGCQINKDLPPYMVVSHHPTRVTSINAEGLKRRGFSATDTAAIKRGFKAIYREDRGGLLSDALDKLENNEKDNEFIFNIVNFIRNSKNGILRGPADGQ
jgi:UDP-N-acetylglucosamine acyltransferase